MFINILHFLFSIIIYNNVSMYTDSNNCPHILLLKIYYNVLQNIPTRFQMTKVFSMNENFINN